MRSSAPPWKEPSSRHGRQDGLSARIAAIDSLRGDGQYPADLDRMRRDAEALTAENERLQAALRHVERQFAAAAQELDGVYHSRSWRVAERLRSLFRRRPAAPDLPALPPAVPGTLEPPPGVVLIVSSTNGNPVAHCNRQAAATRADKIVVWDGLSTPHAGWLESMASTLDGDDRAGMVGAALLARDGLIAAVGATIHADGTLSPRGAGERPDHPTFASLAEVTALPLGAIMVSAQTWRRFGGLDETIASLTLALADLALRLREAGLRVLCQPFARLTEAMPPPIDPWADAFGRWRLRGRRTRGGNGLAALGLTPPALPRVLFVDNLVPTPDRDAASVVMASYLRIFVALGYDTTLLPVGDLDRRDRYVDGLRRHGVRVIANGWVGSPGAFLARETTPFDLLVVYRASVAAGALLDQLQRHSPQARLVFNTVDLHFVRLEREALLLRSPEQLDAAFHAQRLELATIARADCTILLSAAEQPLIAGLLPRARTCVIPIAGEPVSEVAPFGPRHGVLFIGGFRHRPNVDAVVTFVRQTWPLIRRRLATTLSIVGADAPDEVLALADAAAGVAVLGHVEDLDGLLGRCRLTVAPLRFGAGIKGKIVTSLAAGVPCVASPIAVEGMGLSDRTNVRIADTPENFADAVIEVHEQEAVWAALSGAGLDFARDRFSIAGVRQRLAAMLRDLGLPAGDEPA